MKEVLESIDPNYTFDKERNCYVAHDKERDDSVITFTYEKPFVDFFGHKNTSVSATTGIFHDTSVLFDKDSLKDMKEVIARQTNYVRSSDKVRQLIEDSFPQLQNPKFNEYSLLDQTEMTVYSDNIAPFKVSLTWDEEYTTNPDKVADISENRISDVDVYIYPADQEITEPNEHTKHFILRYQHATNEEPGYFKAYDPTTPEPKLIARVPHTPDSIDDMVQLTNHLKELSKPMIEKQVNQKKQLSRFSLNHDMAHEENEDLEP